MKLHKFYLIAVLAGALTVIGCGDSSSSNGGNGGNGVDPDARCNVELCLESEELKANCVREYNSCVDKGGNPENCIVGAVETCTI